MGMTNDNDDDGPRYGGYNREEELELAEIDPDRELREGIEAAERGDTAGLDDIMEDIDDSE